MLDYGYRSKCCFAPLRMGTKKKKNLSTKIKVWVCTKCRSLDVDIVPKDDLESQPKEMPFSE